MGYASLLSPLIDKETEVLSSVTANGRDKTQTQIDLCKKVYLLTFSIYTVTCLLFPSFLISCSQMVTNISFIKLLKHLKVDMNPVETSNHYFQLNTFSATIKLVFLSPSTYGIFQSFRIAL